MTLLAIHLPPRQRAAQPVGDAKAAPEGALPARWVYTRSGDLRTADPLRLASSDHLPKADRTVLVLSETDVAWHQVALPRAPKTRLREVLAGLLEEQLLHDLDQVHLALAPGKALDGKCWVAATHGPYLKAALATLRAAGVRVDQVATALPAPQSPPSGHFDAGELARLGQQAVMVKAGTPTDTPPISAAQLRWTFCTEKGSWHLPLFDNGDKTTFGGLALALQKSLSKDRAEQIFTATPMAAKSAQRFLGASVPVLKPADQLLALAQSPVNLLQFELSSGPVGLRRLVDGFQQLGQSPWRSVRRGALALLTLHLLGLNAYAFQEHRALEGKRQAIDKLFRSTYPQVPVVLDAAAQMQAETERLRRSAGEPGPDDLESALATAAAVWPQGKSPVASLRFQPGRLTLSASDWQEDELAAVRAQLAGTGWAVTRAQGEITLSRARDKGSSKGPLP